MPTILSRWAVVVSGWLAAAAGGGEACSQPPSFTLIPGLGEGRSELHGLSADGTAAAGFSASGGFPGFRWTAPGGRYDFGFEAGLPVQTRARGISADGTTVVGEGTNTELPVNDSRAFRWRAPASGVGPGTYQSLGTIGSYSTSYASGVSGDGEVVVGRVSSQTGQSSQAFRWTQAGGMQGLGFAQPSHFYSRANAVSRTGQVVVGQSADFNTSDAFVWTASGGMQSLPPLPNTLSWVGANGVNGDGTVVVGSAGAPASAVLWRNGQIQDLGLLAGYNGATALVVSDDGGVVAGMLDTGPTTPRAFVWTPGGGMRLLIDYLGDFGVSIPAGWNLRECNGISADGFVFSGIANFPMPGQSTTQAFVARIPAPPTCLAAGLVAGGFLGRRRRAGR